MDKQTAELRAKMWESAMDNHKKYIGKDGFFANKYTEIVNCVVCGDYKQAAVIRKSGGIYRKCLCGHVYLANPLKDKYLAEYYKNNHSLQSEVVLNDSKFYNEIYGRGLDVIEKHLDKYTNKCTLLDFGCSSGSFLNLAKKRGFKTYGVELNEKEAAFAKKKHKISNDINKMLDSYDVITANDVFEHIKNPRKLINEMYSKLSPRGVLFIQTPNAESLALQLMREKCNVVDGAEHCNLFTKEGLVRICTELGLFELICFYQVISEKRVINNFISGMENPYVAEEKVSTMLTDEYIFKYDLGYKNCFLFRKI